MGNFMDLELNWENGKKRTHHLHDYRYVVQEAIVNVYTFMMFLKRLTAY